MAEDRMAEERLIEDPLFLACTRPAMVMGVPMEAMGVNLIVSGIVFLVGGSLLYLLVAPAVHLVFRAICRADWGRTFVFFPPQSAGMLKECPSLSRIRVPALSCSPTPPSRRFRSGLPRSCRC